MSQLLPRKKAHKMFRELGKAPKRDIGGVRDFYNSRVGTKAFPSKQREEGVASPRKGPDYHRPLLREGDYHYGEHYKEKTSYYYHHHDASILSRPHHRRATAFPSGHRHVATTSKTHHNREGNQPIIALGNCHRQRAIAIRNCNHDPRAANLPSQSFPPNEHHREATASPSRKCSGGQSGDTIFLNDQSSTIGQSRTTKHQSIKVQTTHSPAGIKNDGCRPNAEAINLDVFVEVDGPGSLKLTNAEAKTAFTIVRRRASAFRTFPAGCGRLQNVPKKVAVLQPTRKKDTVEMGVDSLGSNRFLTWKDQNESNNQVAESQSIKKKDTEVPGFDSSNSSRTVPVDSENGQKTSIQFPELQPMKREDPEVIEVDLSSGEDKGNVQFKYMMTASKEVAACSSHCKLLYASNQVRESPPIEEQDVEVIGVDSLSEVEAEPQFKEVASKEVIGIESSSEENEDEDQFVTSKKMMSSSSQNNADELMQFEAEDAKAVNWEPEPETKEMEMDAMSHGEKASTEPESQSVIEMDLDEREVGKVTKRKRKKEDSFEIVPLKKGKHEFLVCDNPQAILPISSVAPRSIVEMGDARKKVMDTLFEYRLMLQQKENILQSNQLAYKAFKEKIGGSTSAERFIENVPGVKIGDEFRLRAEMFIIGLHRQHQAGIDYIKQNGKYIAVSIVSSGRYANTQSEAGVLLYSGSGVSHQDQMLTRGNLALKNSIDEKIPVRVIYGVNKYRGKKRTKTYVYDGLYLAEDYTFKKGNQGHFVLMFQLRRIPGQPEIAIDGLQCPRTCISSTVYMDDISKGGEDIPIRVVNAIGRDLPMPFKYITKMILPSSYSLIPPTGCNCVDGCYDSKRCTCAAKNGGKFLFNFDGAIRKAIYECGPSCTCPPTCPNRVSQHGIKIKLEVFKTESRGWGVRSPNLIQSGSFVCEYIGEILADEEAQKGDNDEYLFGMGYDYHDKGHSCPIPSASRELVEGSFTVDAMKFGNVGRFINHSCSPNLYAQDVLYDHDDTRMPHIMLFAGTDIQPFEELTYDYNYAIDQVHDSSGNIKKKECHCGSEECTGWLY